VPSVEDKRLLLGAPWSLPRGIQQGLTIGEHAFHLRPPRPDGHPKLPILIVQCFWVCWGGSGLMRSEKFGQSLSAWVSCRW
jgi:hypothetical protein